MNQYFKLSKNLYYISCVLKIRVSGYFCYFLFWGFKSVYTGSPVNIIATLINIKLLILLKRTNKKINFPMRLCSVAAIDLQLSWLQSAIGVALR